MNLSDFLASPTRITHPAYDGSFLTSARPEYSTGEVLLGSAYRRLLLDCHDREVDLEEINQLPERLSKGVKSSGDMWRSLLLERNGLASPPPGGPQKHGLPQLMPLVPEIGRYACVLGKKRDRWYPGTLLLQVIGAGKGNREGQRLLDSLAQALTVATNDDLFARFLDNSLSSLVDAPPTKFDLKVDSRANHPATLGRTGTPAERFCNDLDSILSLKGILTRRQWTVLIESLMRIGLTMHVLWVCRINAEFWHLLLRVAAGEAVPAVPSIEALLWSCHNRMHPILEIGTDATPRIRETISGFVQAQIGINLLLFRLGETGNPWDTLLGLGSETGEEPRLSVGIQSFLEHVGKARLSLDANDPRGYLERESGELIDAHREEVEGRSGSSKNLFEFARYSLGQVQPAFDDEKAYDQGYLLIRKNRSRTSPWPVRFGPAMLIALVHAVCAAQNGVPASIEDLRDHLEQYGIWAGVGELSQGQTGADLERLGLVIDSPDALGGRLLVAPFSSSPAR